MQHKLKVVRTYLDTKVYKCFREFFKTFLPKKKFYISCGETLINTYDLYLNRFLLWWCYFVLFFHNYSYIHDSYLNDYTHHASFIVCFTIILHTQKHRSRLKHKENAHNTNLPSLSTSSSLSHKAKFPLPPKESTSGAKGNYNCPMLFTDPGLPTKISVL